MVTFSARAVGAWLFLFTSLAFAADPLTLRQAVELALRGNPDLQGFAFELRAQDARARQAGLSPSPELSINVENALGRGDYHGLSTAETTFALSQVIELGGKRGRRIAAAQFGREVVSTEQQAAQLDVLAEVARRFIHVAADQEQLELTRRATELNRGTVEAVKRRVEAAKSPEVELHRADTARIRAEIDQRHAEHELLASRRKLAAMWGQPEAEFGVAQADLYRLLSPPTFETLIARLQTNPDFLRFASEARLRDAEIRLAQAQRAPDVTLSAGARRLEATDDVAFVFGASIPLFAGSRGAPRVAETQALRGQLDTQRNAAFVKARAQLFELYQELQHAIGETTTLQQQVLPQMEEALKETEYAYERGRYSYIELVDGQRAYVEVKRALIQAAANAQLFQAEIERLTAEPLATGIQP